MNVSEIIKLFLPLPPEQRAALMSQHLFGFDALVGMRFEYVDPSRVCATLVVTDRHTQPYGLVHGGVYASLGESTCSVGAALAVMAAGKNAVGMENTTRFHRGARPGTTLHIEALPQTISSRIAIWQAQITSGQGIRHATSRVKVAILPAGTQIAGEDLRLVSGLGLDPDRTDP